MGKHLKRIIGICIGTAAAWSVAVKPRIWKKPDLSEIRRYDYAHRGFRGIDGKLPENSLPAFRSAIEHGYGISMEVRITRDGVPVVFSDSRLDRLTGSAGTVENSSLEEIKELTLSGTEEKIPTLAEALALIDGQVPVLLDLCVDGDNYYALSDQVCEVVDTYEGIFSIQSTDPRVLRWYRKQRNEYIRGQKIDFTHKSGTELRHRISDFLANCLLLNFLAEPDYVATNIDYRMNPSLILCRLLYRVPRMDFVVRTLADYELVRTDGSTAVFEDIEL